MLEGENLRHLWGAANRITLARGGLLALLAGFLFAPEAPGLRGWLPALLYAAAAAADALDGFWARRTGTRTRLGALLDGELDGVGLLLAMTLTVQYGRLPAAFLAIGLAKPAYAAALAIQRLAGGHSRDLPPSYLRRRLAGFQMGVAAVCLWPLARPPGTTLAQALIGLPFLAGFLRDGLAAGGLLDPLHPAYRLWKARLGRLAFPGHRLCCAPRRERRPRCGLPPRWPPGCAGARPAGRLAARRSGFLPAAAQPAAAALAAVLQLPP